MTLGGAVINSLVAVENGLLGTSNAAVFLIKDQLGRFELPSNIASITSSSLTRSRYHQHVIYAAMGRAIGVPECAFAGDYGVRTDS